MIDDESDQKPENWNEEENGVWTKKQIVNP